MEKPLVSLILLAYNQEQYIREAVEGALAQTYEPLEIVISDDCSPDQTFEIMKQLVEAYDGPHHVILNRCEQNLGLAGHINHVMRICSGELIAIAAGDDVSLPHRVSTLTEAWINSGKKSGCLYSGYIEIDEDGEQIGLRHPRFQAQNLDFTVEQNGAFWGAACVYGCTNAWTRDVFEVFGELDSQVVFEDKVIAFRSKILGNVSFLNEPTIRYRVLPKSLSHFSTRGMGKETMANMNGFYRRLGDVLSNFQRDLTTAHEKKLIDGERYLALREIFAREFQRTDIYRRLLESNFLTRLRITTQSGNPFPVSQRLKFLLVAFFPGIYGRRTGQFISKVKNLVRR